MQDRKYAICEACNAQVELPARFCAMCGAPLSAISCKIDLSNTLEEEKTRDAESVYDWRTLEVLKEWPPELFTPQKRMRRGETPPNQNPTGLQIMRELVRQVEGGGSPDRQDEDGPVSTDEVPTSRPEFTIATFVDTLQKEIIRTGYPLNCKIVRFDGPGARRGSLVALMSAGLALAGEYMYSISISLAGKDLLVQVRLLRINYLKQHIYWNVFRHPKQDVSAMQGVAIREIIESLPKFERRLAGLVAHSQLISDLPPFLPDTLKQQWQVFRRAVSREDQANSLTSWLQEQRESAMSKEMQFLDHNFRDPGMPEFSTLAEKAFKSACEHWFGKPPTLRLLDYESSN